MEKRRYEIRTPRQGAMIGTIGKIGEEPVAVIKQGKRVDTLSLDEFASALYGQRVKCIVMPMRVK